MCFSLDVLGVADHNVLGTGGGSDKVWEIELEWKAEFIVPIDRTGIDLSNSVLSKHMGTEVFFSNTAPRQVSATGLSRCSPAPQVRCQWEQTAAASRDCASVGTAA